MIRKSKVITLTSSKGGVGKSVFICNLAGCFSYLKKKVLIIDNDLYTGSISCMLNLKSGNTIYNLVDDILNNRFKEFNDYVSSYNDYIDVLCSPVDPRDGNKIDAKYIERIINMCKYHYDVVLIDTNHLPIATNLVAMDNCDTLLYMISNDCIDLKNSKSAISIYNDILEDKVKVILNNSCHFNRKSFSTYEIKSIINHDIDYVISSSMYVKNIDKYIMDGCILVLSDKLCIKDKERNMLIKLCNDLWGE